MSFNSTLIFKKSDPDFGRTWEDLFFFASFEWKGTYGKQICFNLSFISFDVVSKDNSCKEYYHIVISKLF